MSLFNCSKFSITRMPLTDIAFAQDNTNMTLKIQDDITAKESAQLSIMFAVAVGSSQSLALWDYLGYIRRNGLERHFEFKENQ